MRTTRESAIHLVSCPAKKGEQETGGSQGGREAIGKKINKREEEEEEEKEEEEEEGR